eukprot:1186843-Prorocentrum_minimum.AAC.1
MFISNLVEEHATARGFTTHSSRRCTRLAPKSLTILLPPWALSTVTLVDGSGCVGVLAEHCNGTDGLRWRQWWVVRSGCTNIGGRGLEAHASTGSLKDLNISMCRKLNSEGILAVASLGSLTR